MITVWDICTDNGPDPTGCRHMLHNQTGRDPTSWVFDTNCFLHQYQLIIKAELFTLDFLMKNLFGLDFGFFAMMSKTMHLWRDKSHDIYLCIAWQFGAQAGKVASTVPPKCIAARWGCISRYKYESRTLGFSFVHVSNQPESYSYFEVCRVFVEGRQGDGAMGDASCSA